ncbi:hypothetical protein BABINDRAFT_162392 [Babjeviella inositovora NRRL Y-12698]|uniref:Tyrosine--tRNA ligase n=1 Tax=Babjeviella inositovora NRRL Y-12698 TaxID=984486 RepID=A0A1E3QM08_9ASCO|nr:uncharacterized protein BABINDRAFT_162392 [Babjeviella inositovora NRRL Y-12698]ODQ78690.1 hypothetical protein BABINDRAFT_162392 [Babjeviella inositovora NRRL Y-12698]
MLRARTARLGFQLIPRRWNSLARLEELSAATTEGHAADVQEPLISHLRSRGLLQSITHEELSDIAEKHKLGLYCGADPTARSLHLGNLLPLMILLHFNLRGHDVIGLVGGATVQVGDPSGRTTERDALDAAARDDNVLKIQAQLQNFLEQGLEYAKTKQYPIKAGGAIQTKNNYSWWHGVKMLEFLGTYGRFIRVGQMISRDSVKNRLESANGIGFNEFSYQILQAFDFWHMWKHDNVSVQVGGNDQWGNITAGVDFITRLKGQFSKEEKKAHSNQRGAFGITVPLLTTANGTKFGKSAGNAVFIDSAITPPFEIYQYFIKTPDADVKKLLHIFTLLPLLQVKTIMEQHETDPALRLAQRILAAEVTDLIHGAGSGHSAELITSFLYPLPNEPYKQLASPEEAQATINALERAGIMIRFSKVNFINKKYSEILQILTGSSKSDARRLVTNGSVYVGVDRVKVDESDELLLTEEYLIQDRLLLLRVGKGKFHVVDLV